MRSNETVVNSVEGQQLLVGAFFYHTPLMNDRYDVSILYGRQPMSDNDGCTTLTCTVQCRLDNLF